MDKDKIITSLDGIRKYHLEYHIARWISDDILNDFGDKFAEELGIVEDEFETEYLHIPRQTDDCNK